MLRGKSQTKIAELDHIGHEVLLTHLKSDSESEPETETHDLSDYPY